MNSSLKECCNKMDLVTLKRLAQVNQTELLQGVSLALLIITTFPCHSYSGKQPYCVHCNALGNGMLLSLVHFLNFCFQLIFHLFIFIMCSWRGQAVRLWKFRNGFKSTEELQRRKCFPTISENFLPEEVIEVNATETGELPVDFSGHLDDEVSSTNLHEGGGKPGFVSFYNPRLTIANEVPPPNVRKNQNSLLWFAGPAILVASFILPSLYLRRIISLIFEDSLLTGNLPNLIFLVFKSTL